MPSATLIVYEPLESFGEVTEYWERYLRFYERYWGGPTSPFGIWFGNEYSAFRQALSDYLNLPDEDLQDCLFMKERGGGYFVAPTDSHNCFSSENIIPFEWFLLFSEGGRKSFYTHWGFNSIHYNSTLEESKKMLVSSREKIEKTISEEGAKPLGNFLRDLDGSLEHLRKWLVQFDDRGYVVLNYGDICNHIHPYTLKNENSVAEAARILDLVSLSGFGKAELSLKLFFQKWDDIAKKCAGGGGRPRLQ